MVFDMQRWEPIREVLLLSGAKYPESIPFLDSHDRGTISNTLGSTTNFRRSNGNLIAKNIYATTEEGERAWTLTKEGHVNSNSIGYKVNKHIDIEPGEKAKIKGREFIAPKDSILRVTTSFNVIENSAVIVPADPGAKTREDINGQKKPLTTITRFKELIMFEQWLKERGIEIDSLTDEQRSALENDFKAMTKPEEPVKNEPTRDEPGTISDANKIVAEAKERERIKKEALKAERERIEAIQELGKPDIPVEVIDQCIREDKTVEEAQGIFLQIIKNSRKAIEAPAIQIRDNSFDTDDMVAGLLIRGNLENIAVKELGEQRADKGNRLRDVCLHDLCIRSLAMEGKQIPLGRDEMLRTAFASLTLPKILGATANIAALDGYRNAPATWRPWCSIGSVSNFQTQTRARLTDRGELEEVNNSGEIPAGFASEEYEQFNIATYGKTFPITRQNIIDDNISVLTQTPQRMGRKAALLVSKLVYTHLLANGNMGDGSALFVSGHSNLNTSCAFAEAGLDTALTAFMQQTDADSQPIDVTPKYLIIPPELHIEARRIMESELRLYGADDETTVMAKNVFRGMLEIITEYRLSNSSYTNYSTTTWYLAGNPSEVDTIEVAFLNGKQEPTVEKFDADPSTLGIIYRIYLDVGVKSLDWRGMSKNTA